MIVFYILTDDVITDDERAALLDTLNQLLGSPVESSVTNGMSTEPLITKNAVINIPYSVFCLTGKFITNKDLVICCGD